MAYSFNGSSQYLNVASAPVTAAPLTIAVWFFSTSTTAQQGIATICNSVGDVGFRIQAFGSLATDPIRVNALNTGAANGATDTSTAYTANIWQHACGVYTSATSRTAYLNGGGATTNTLDVTPPSVDRIHIGAVRNVSAPSNFFIGRLAEIGIWNAALTQGEVIALANGVSCSKIRSGNLVFYAPLIRDLVDIRGGRIIGNNGAAPVIDHPRIYM